MTKIVTKDINTKKLAAVTLSVVAGLAAFATPALANAQSYHNDSYSACRTADKDAQVIGGLLGAVVGGVVGSQVSGNGARTEGSVLGAVLGGAAGVGIADDRRNCRSEAGIQPVNRTVYRSGGYAPAPTTYRGTSGYNNGAVITVGHSGHNSHGYRGGNRSYSYDRGYDRRDRSLDRIDRRIRNLRAELRDLRRNRHHNGYRYTERRIEQVGYELDRLKDKKRRIKKGYNGSYRRH